MKFGFVIGLLIIISLGILMPLLYIWALNTLFSLTISYTLETWSAMVLLQMFFHYTISISKKDKK
jgi:hypothetical protein